MAGAARRRFCSVRKLPSGLYQVRYYGPDGRRRSAPMTFVRKAKRTDTSVFLRCR